MMRETTTPARPSTQNPRENRSDPRDPVRGGGPYFAAYLEDAAFPQNREAILKFISENVPDNEVILDRFRRIPDSVYNSIEDVRNALGEEYENYGVVKKTEEKNVQASQTDRR